MYRLMEEMEEVMGDKPDIEADDLEKLTYMTQVWTTSSYLYVENLSCALIAHLSSANACRNSGPVPACCGRDKHTY